MSEWLKQLAAVGAVAGLAAGWLAVQFAWRRAFPQAFGDPGADPDPLAGRLGCHGCGECKNQCDPERPARTPTGGEERS